MNLDPIRAAYVLARAGFIEPLRPDRGLRSLVHLAKWGPTGAAAFIGADRAPDHPAVADDAGVIAYKELNERSNALANAWRESEPETIGILCRNGRTFVLASLASMKLGAHTVFLNTMLAAPALAGVCEREGVDAVVCDEDLTPLVPSRVRRYDEREIDRLCEVGDRREPSPPPSHGRIVLLSSGTTGTPKGARRSNMKGLATAAAIASKIPLRAREATMIAPPLFHAFGFLQASLCLGLGSTQVLRRRFDPDETLRAVEAQRCTTLVLVPLMLKRILDAESHTRFDTSSLRAVVVSGSRLSADLATRCLEAFGDVLYNLYGSTEVGWATIATPEDLRAAPGCAGRPPLGTTVRLYDGRIFVGSGMPFDEYTGGGGKDIKDGLIATGDLGHFDDDGRLWVDAREDEMIVSGGENVFPAEVEEALLRHPLIADAAVAGVDHPELGQALAAFVVPREGATIGEDDVRGFVKQTLAAFKVPRHVRVMDALPRNAAGKVIKRDLAV